MTDQATGPAFQDAVAHGGNLSQAAARFGIPEREWLDLSTGINPIPYPDTTQSPASLARLPSAGALDALLSTARKAYGLPPETAICAAPGTQALIQWLPLVVGRARTVAVVGPTYSEHAHVWRSAGHAVREVAALSEIGDADVAVLANPNNPDGRRWDPATLDAARQSLAGKGGLLIVDEAFADVAPELSLAPVAGVPGLVVLRSFGKFFGLAGVRLGFAAGPADLIAALGAGLGPWAVSGPAIEVGRRALADRRWIEETRKILGASRARLDGLLHSAGFEIVGGTDLFRLVIRDDARALFLSLAARGILTRPFTEHPRWLRFGLPGDDAAFDRLARALPRP